VAASQAKLDDANKGLQDLLAGPTQAEFAAAQLEVDNAQKALDDLLAGTSPDTLAAAEADVVKASTKLDELKAGPTASDVAGAQSQVDKAQAKLDGLKVGPTSDEVASAEADVVKAQTTLNELQAGPTADKVAAAQSQVDKATNALNDLKAGPTRADVAEAESQVAQKQADLQKLQEPASTSDVALAEEAVVTAQKDVDDGKADLDSTVLRAPFSGTVGTVSAEVNSQVTVGSEALSIYDPNGMHVDLEVSESDIEKVKVGQQANLTFDAIPNQVVTGTVTSVSTVATSGQDVVTYKVGVQFKPGTLPARVGMNSTATLIVESKQGVIQVPTRAITTQGPLKTVKVLYGQEETPVTVSVTTGATNGQMTEIVSCTETGNQCLRQGDKVAVTISTGTSNQQPGGNQFIGPGGDFGISVSPGGPGNGPRRIEIAP
jgi:RND family efflux transporter MFP subunit